MEYILTQRWKFEAIDDPDARILAGMILRDKVENSKVEYVLEQKLQRIRKDGPPQKVDLD